MFAEDLGTKKQGTWVPGEGWDGKEGSWPKADGLNMESEYWVNRNKKGGEDH